ncbi:MAG: flavin reductase [Microbacteriaceae bacterium]|nr:flavin reductase [Cryobacterium sp.]MBX3104489.1 flavin reductase [Cryobacterium sp.]MCC6376910.1 flavin reductase [Microbacteriaceae bacterium]
MASRIQKGFEPGSRLYQPPQLHLRGSFSRFATGVAVLTFEASDGRHGITINSFTSVSMEPPLVLVSIARSTKTHDELSGKPFTVNILGAEQEDIAKHYSGRPNREPTWVQGDIAPRLSGPLAWFSCTPWAEYDGGDHTLYLGEVQQYDYRRGDALGFVGGRFVTIPENLGGHEALI